jgi:GT2 family glycosyltransferase
MLRLDLPELLVSVAIPTLIADARLWECLESLKRQTRQDFEVIVVDNSGRNLVRRNGAAARIRVIENARNVGFGAAMNQAFRASQTPYLATLNDDAAAQPGWLDALVRAMEDRPDVGMCASAVRLPGDDRLDSAGMLMAADGSSKQRGHGKAVRDFPVLEEALFPSASAALYRRAMMEELGGFDDCFFLYCEDTDLGLRARWNGWKCLYVPGAVVEHHYSHSAGRASPVKAYYVERNRLFVAAKNFPMGMLLASPFVAFARYFWHAWYMLQGRGSAALFREEGNAGIRMAWYVIKAHAALLAHAGRLWRQRRRIRASARITPAAFRNLLRTHSISARSLAGL